MTQESDAHLHNKKFTGKESTAMLNVLLSSEDLFHSKILTSNRK